MAKEFGGEVFGIIMSLLAGELGCSTHGEVTEAKPELRVRARKAAALTVGEVMVAAGRFGVGLDKRQQLRGTVRVCVPRWGWYPHMKMHEFQNKEVTEKAFRKSLKSSGHPFGVVV